MQNTFYQRSRCGFLALSVLLTALACAPNSSPPNTAASPTVTASSQTDASSVKDSNMASNSQLSQSETEFKAQAVAISATAQSSGRGYQDLSEYRLPEDVDIAQVKIVEAHLDGREIDTDQLSLGSDEAGNLIFFMSKDLLSKHLSDSAEVSISIHSSDLFIDKTEALTEDLLSELQDQLREDVDEALPTPSFLSAQVRGESLTRQQVASLKKDAGKLAKEGIFIDRTFYCVLEVNGDTFSVQQAKARHLMNKFTLTSDQLEQIFPLLSEKNEDLPHLTAVAERIAEDDANFFRPLDALSDSSRVVEIEEIEEVLELALGAELGPQGVPFDEVEIPLDPRRLALLESKRPELVGDPRASIVDDRGDAIDAALQAARSRAERIASVFDRLGRRPIPDVRLFDPLQLRPPRFGNRPLRRPADAFAIPTHLLPPLPRTDGENPALPDGTCPPPPPGPEGMPVPAPTPLENGNCPVGLEPEGPPEGDLPPRSGELPPPPEGAPLPQGSSPPPGASPPPPEGAPPSEGSVPPPGASPPPSGASPPPGGTLPPPGPGLPPPP